MLVSPIPLVYVPTATATKASQFEKGLTQHWSYGEKRYEQKKMLDMLFKWKFFKKGRELIILGGYFNDEIYKIL
ncbi:hypothetical protein MHBO_001086 [Bonamia ostreae]|uniref:Uncharacterized protein n=1 Tax=Bonamia ostreae TaxID=126728 RepID=A0ABV2AHS3_9EUKA